MSKTKLHAHIPGLPQKSHEFRLGDSQIVYDDDKNAILIDGGEGDLWKKMLAFIKGNGLNHVTFILTHWHPDHDCALRAALESPDIIVDKIYAPPLWELRTIPDGVGEYRRGAQIIGLARDLGKAIVYPTAGKVLSIKVGAIRCWLWRRKVNKSDTVDYQVNNTSIQTYFPDLEYHTGGDMINAFAGYLRGHKKYKITGFKINHHGNSQKQEECELLEAAGAKICYYNDWEPKGVSIGGTSFTKYGAKNCKEHFVVLRPFWDIDITADGAGHVTWAQNGKKWTYDIDYGAAAKRAAAVIEKTQATVTRALRDMKTLYGMDVSFAQGTIDWDKAAKEIDFVILQCGYGQDRTSQDDKTFSQNAAECERLGIPYGIYLYSYAGSTSASAGEAAHALRLAKGRQLSLPIYDDLEETRYGSAAAGVMSVFGQKVEAAGYWAGLYTGEYYYNDHLGGVTRFTKWIAKYGANNGRMGNPPNVKSVAIWQYSSKGRISGVSGVVDINVMFDDLIKAVTGKDYIQAARDVWADKYGGGEERIKKLTAAGFDPRIVQHLVDRMTA